MAEEVRKAFKSLEHKNYENALMNFLRKECKFMGGPRILEIVASGILDITKEYFVPKECLESGDLLWTAVTTDIKNVSKKMQETQKKIVRLPIADKEKIMDLIGKVPMREIKKKIVSKMAKVAYEQGATLSCSDIAAIMTCSPSTISKYSREVGEREGEPLPLRGYVHDIGPSLSHKVLIIKEHLKGKTGKKVARDTKHTQKATDRYIKSYEKVKITKKYTDDVAEIAYITGQSKRLVKEYVLLMEQFEKITEKNKTEVS